MARPPLMWSRVVASFAVIAGGWNVLAPTNRPSSTVRVRAAHAAQDRPCLQDRLVGLALRCGEVVDRPELIESEVVDELGRADDVGPAPLLRPEADPHAERHVWVNLISCRQRGRESSVGVPRR